MADTKITALTALTGSGLAASDLFAVVDVSDTTMAGSGTDKNITRDELIIGLAKAPTRQVLTVGSGTYNTPAGCVAIDVEVLGGGGGGGATAGSASQAAAAAGGASGGYARKLIAAPAGTYAYTVGAKGTGGTAGTNPGNTGSDSTFGAGGGLITAKGGGPGGSMGLGTGASYSNPGTPGGVSTGADVNGGGAPGAYGSRASATIGIAGDGGSSAFGGGGQGRNSDGVGNAATGPGSGGAGALTLSVNTAHAGGDGTDGLIVVTEHY